MMGGNQEAYCYSTRYRCLNPSIIYTGASYNNGPEPQLQVPHHSYLPLPEGILYYPRRSQALPPICKNERTIHKHTSPTAPESA